MVKIIYDNYEVIDNSSDAKGIIYANDPKYKNSDIVNRNRYSDKVYNDMRNSGDYIGAKQYGNKYKFKDRAINDKFHALVNKNASIADQKAQTYSCINSINPDAAYRYEVINNLDKLGSLKNNPYAEKLITLADNLGSRTDKYGKTIKPSALGFTFYPERGLDVTKRDNNRFTTFINEFGEGDEKELVKKGISVIHNKDNSIEIRLNKDNPLFYKTLEHVYRNQGIGNGKTISNSTMTAYYTDFAYEGDKTIGYKSIKNIPIYNSANEDSYNMRDIYSIMHKSRRQLKKFENDTDNYVESTSIVGSAFSKEDKAYALDFAKQINWQRRDKYRIAYNSSVEDKDKDSNQSLTYIDDDTKISDLYNLITSADKNNIAMSDMVVNGKHGTLITYNALETKPAGHVRGMDIGSKTTSKAVQVFIEGLVLSGHENFEELDSYSSAINKTNIIKSKSYYTHKLNDGGSIRYDSNSGFFIKSTGEKVRYDEDGNEYIIPSMDEYLTEQQVTNAINIDNIITDGQQELYRHFVSDDGSLSNREDFENLIIKTAVSSANEMFPNDAPLTLESIQDIIKMLGAHGEIAPMYRNMFNLSTLDKLDSFGEIYFNLFKTLNWFNNNENK